LALPKDVLRTLLLLPLNLFREKMRAAGRLIGLDRCLTCLLGLSARLVSCLLLPRRQCLVAGFQLLGRVILGLKSI
jgi:hypothetical protein